MDALAIELSRKRKVLDEHKKSANSGASSTKFIKRGDVERAREEEYRLEEAKREKEREEKRLAKEKELEARIAQKEKDYLTQDGPNESETKSRVDDLADADLISELRELKEPAILFAETVDERRKRLSICRKRHMASHRKKNEQKSIDFVVKIDDIKNNPSFVYSQIEVYLSFLLDEWEKYMASRPEEEKRSKEGMQAEEVRLQAVRTISPLLKGLRKKEFMLDVFVSLANIVMHMQSRDYVKAADAYYKVSIGNAAWPIGVTMVGIHKRSAQEKIKIGEIAHVLNDETTRKWLQSLKRLITFAQQRFPPETSAKFIG